MDTYPVSGCKLLRSCFCLVMQLNQNQFYCSDPIGNLLISFYFTFCLVTVLGSFVSSLVVTFWSYILLYLPKRTGIRRLQFSATDFFLQSFSWWSAERTQGAQQFAVLGWLKTSQCHDFLSRIPQGSLLQGCAVQRISLSPTLASCSLFKLQVLHFSLSIPCPWYCSLPPHSLSTGFGFFQAPHGQQQLCRQGKPGNQLNNCFKLVPGDESQLLGYPKVWW